MLNANNAVWLSPLTLKHAPFSNDGIRSDKSKTAPKSTAGKPFTYKNIHGQPMTLVKKTYSWTDPSKLDKDGKLIGERLEAVLKVETGSAYTFEEYDTNEFERVSLAEGWDNSQVLQMLQAAPDTLQKTMSEQKEAYRKWEKKQIEIDSKLTAVITNYTSLYTTYENVRLEISAMAAELPALKNSPFDRPYFIALTPIVENMAKINFPELVKNPEVVVPKAPEPMAAPLVSEGGIKPAKAKSKV